jgi:hypothetical protein
MIFFVVTMMQQIQKPHLLIVYSLCCLFSQSEAFCQETDFYKIYTTDLQTPATPLMINAFERGEFSQKERDFGIWAPRLYPSANFNAAAHAQFEYVTDFSTDPPETPGISDAKWTQLGPVGNDSNTPTVGQIHRITFHPGYDRNRNRTMYASSGFGGLWMSKDGGENWTLMNTDNTLPFCGVADVAVSATGNYVFAATGYPDGSIYGTLQPNVSSVNPLFTQGVFRTSDDGQNWIPMNHGLLHDFADGGVIRRIICDPTDANHLVLVSSIGIYYTENALSPEPNWKKGLLNSKPIHDPQLRGL